jgi:hypothetical protein
MSTPISNEYATMVDGAERAEKFLATPITPAAAGPGVAPRLSAAVDDAALQTQKDRDRVRDGADKTKNHTNGLKELQEAGAGKVGGVGGPPMPAMPTVPQSAAEAPMAAAAPAMSAPAMSAPAPSGLSGIDPSLLMALIAATQQQAQVESLAGLTPTLAGSAADATSATTPQPGQPLSVSQVSLQKSPYGQLSQGQVASVIDQALTINGVPNDPQLRAQWQQVYQHMAQGESALDPNAVNTWDTNATGARQSDGAPANSSRGMWQCIPSTFAQYHMAGTSNSIYDPVASAAASMNYVMNRYNVSPTGEGLASFAASRGVGRGTYTGY